MRRGMIDWDAPSPWMGLTDQEIERRMCNVFGHSYCPECDEKEIPKLWICQHCGDKTTECPDMSHPWDVLPALGVKW